MVNSYVRSIFAASAGFILSANVAVSATLEVVKGAAMVNRGQGFAKTEAGSVLRPGDAIAVDPTGQARVAFGPCHVTVRAGFVYVVPQTAPCTFGPRMGQQSVGPQPTGVAGDPPVAPGQPVEPWQPGSVEAGAPGADGAAASSEAAAGEAGASGTAGASGAASGGLSTLAVAAGVAGAAVGIGVLVSNANKSASP
jgi:hypothetical protein